jgi:hypothetical protein
VVVQAHVAVAVDLAAGNVATRGLPLHRVPRAEAALFPFHFGREVGEREHHLVHRGVERALAVLEVEEHPGARAMICFSA